VYWVGIGIAGLSGNISSTCFEIYEFFGALKEVNILN
jgi:hypothetical protein